MTTQEEDGTLVLERLAELNQLEEFYDAIDSDHFEKAHLLMSKAGIDESTIQMVLKKMQESEL